MTNSVDRPWFVFYGTRTAIISAPDEDGAYQRFVAAFSPDHGDHGRLVPPGRDEVRIREPRASDRGWIEDAGMNRQFLAALPPAPVIPLKRARR